MLAIGGEVWSRNDQDLTPQGLSIFDMTELSWKRNGDYDAGAEPYKSPRVVEEWYKDRNLSSLSWASEEVKNMFLARPVNFDEPTSTPAPTSPASGEESSPSKIGPIVGGVVGGLFLIGVIAGMVYYFRFRKSKTSSPNKSETGGTETRPEFRKELSDEGRVTEMYVPPRELHGNSNPSELNAAARERHSAQAYELEGNAAARGNVAGS